MTEREQDTIGEQIAAAHAEWQRLIEEGMEGITEPSGGPRYPDGSPCFRYMVDGEEQP